ncbi:phosphatidyl ethanolamine-binding protein-like protein [Cotonvirus japonicus]|uniref:Phosphatidyl ethanolamine-binding protein-like protein n=1 Tax=Cotonvirus japonicus TaxID=2811091 RepID=A0ABM7NTG5_9VIRU|nr:phosphatidyl ethanolamine-binding protein-like protein [Cotonvirus japonicus]BCS83470.1 phosphatidyl ethanolamine-binding protein-like protein [Cotonvirus japonicus]
MSDFRVNINGIIITNNMILPLKQTQIMPKITCNSTNNDYYTIIVVDPDAPSPKNPIYKYFLHLLIINNNETIVPYKYPSPPKNSGLHRYYFYLMKQSNYLKYDKLGLQINDNHEVVRQKFNFGEFIQNNNLKQVDFVYFLTENK